MDANNLQVRWKHHQMGVMDYLRQLLVSEVFVDVTLCCQNKRFKAHRILLSACSSYLQQVLVEHLASDHVTIILPDIHPDDMQWLLDFMYTGSVAVPRCRLPSFLQAAEALHIKILTHMAQLQKATESDSIVCIPACSPALDVKLTNHPKYQKHLLNSNIDTNNIKPDNLPEDVKHPVCNDDSKSSTESSKLLNMRQEFKNVTEERKSCVFNCLMDNSPYEPRRTQTPIERDNVSCKSNLKASSLYNGLSKRTELHEGTKEEKNVDGEDCSSEGVEVGNSRCNTNMIHNAVDGNNESLGRSSENVALPYLEKPLHNKSSCDSKDVAENLNSNHNATPPPPPAKLVKVPRAERVYSNDRVTPSGEGGSTSEYGFQFSSNTDLHIIPKGNNNQINSNIEYIQDMRVTEDLSLRNQHRNYLPENFEHYPQYLQRLSQWPKPLPSLMPISNNNYQYNGQFPPAFFSKDGRINGVMTHQQMRPTDRKETLPDHLQNMKDIIPGIGPSYQTCGVAAEQHFLKENRCARGVWLSGRDKPMHLNGHKSPSDCRRLSQRVPRLSPIVPPSPWAQHHRPPCAAPVVCPPRGGPLGLNYQPANWMTPKQTSSPVQTFVGHGGGSQQTTSLPTPTGHQQPLGDLTRPPSSTQLPNVVPTAKTCRSPSPHTKYLKKPESNGMGYDQTSIRKRTSESIDMFCKLKERRLQDFYREQLTKLRTGGHESQEKDDEVASDLSTKSSQSPIRSPISHSARSSPSDYQRMISSPLTPSTVSLQQKLKTFAELSSPKLSTCDDRLSCKENIKEEDSTKLTKNCDIDANSIGLKTEETGSGSIDDKKLQLPDIKRSGHEQNGEDQDCGQGDDDVQILSGARRTTLTKNDNNNNNGLVDDSAQAAPVAKSHGCEDCGKFFSRRQLLVQHRRIHTGERPYSCADCGRQFTQRGHWSTHQKLHEPARRPEHACPSCGKAFVTRASLKVHLRTHTGEKPFQCGECGKQFSQLRNYKYHRSVHEGTREFAATCPECGKYFNDRGYLSSHMKIHRNRKEYGCQYCGKSFNQRVAYNMHVRIHTGERPHSCPHCNKSFSRKMLLKQHLRIHTGEKPFACSVCGKAFADRSNMTLHMRLHSGIKPYSCQLCSKAFTKKHHLKTHLNYHTGTKPYSCTKCGLRFSQSSNMRTHYKKCTSTGPTNVETAVNKTETTKSSGTDRNGASSPSSSPGRSDVTMTSPSSSAAVITPPHSDESSCGSTVISRNAIEAQPA